SRHANLVAPVETVTLSKTVAYNDLDLTTTYGAYIFRQRVRASAHSVCNRLVGRYGGGTPDRNDCYKSANDQAQLQADVVMLGSPIMQGSRRVASRSPADRATLDRSPSA